MRRSEAGHGWRLLPAIPALAALGLVLASGALEREPAIVLMALIVALTLAAALLPRWRGHRDLHALERLVDALREGDFAARTQGVRAGRYAGLGGRIDALARHLHDERRGLHESLQLLAKTLAALDGAVFAFEQDGRLRLVNPAGERLLARPAPELLGRDGEALGLSALFDLPSGGVHAFAFPGQHGRWQIGHAILRSRSQAGRLLIVQPMERALRDEEAQAFRRLLRVLSHEINNSLAPIASMSDTLRRLLPTVGTPLDAARHADLVRGLELIEHRSAALQRFLGGYARLARLPPPRTAVVALVALCERVGQLLDEPRVRIENGMALDVIADADQLEHVLINVLRNALEASEGDEPVVLKWTRDANRGCIRVVDRGKGLPASDSLFVPFFTTKPHGAGIGLVLSRQIIEAQGGSLTLMPGADGRGAVAEIVLPASP